MKKFVISLFLTGLVTLVSIQAKPKGQSFSDPSKAGPDWTVQGEYLGNMGSKKLGAEVIARGEGKFEVNFLPGGLRGEGGDYKKRITGSGEREGATTTLQSKDGKWKVTISDGLMTGKAASGEMVKLKKTIRKSKTLGMKPPENAIVLYGGPQDVNKWKGGKVIGENLVAHDNDSKMTFKDHQIHLEFRLTFVPQGRGQARSNSGVYPQHRYEVQVLDSFGLEGRNNECGGIYSKAAPKVNMCFPPLTWQTYDIDFKAARFDSSGKKTANAVITVRHNGVLIHDQFELNGITGGGRPETPEGGPLFLQGHGGGVQYRNIWVIEK